MGSSDKNTSGNSSPTVKKRPTFILPPSDSTDDLLSRLNAFLPQLSAANALLTCEETVKSLNIENVGENEDKYIEMNLGLGVLEEIHPSDSESEGRSENGVADVAGRSGGGTRKEGAGVLETLLGNHRSGGGKKSAGIMEIGNDEIVGCGSGVGMGIASTVVSRKRQADDDEDSEEDNDDSDDDDSDSDDDSDGGNGETDEDEDEDRQDSETREGESEKKVVKRDIKT